MRYRQFLLKRINYYEENEKNSMQRNDKESIKYFGTMASVYRECLHAYDELTKEG